MRIAFVSGNQEKLPDAVIPLGLLQVMASTPDHHEKRLIDLCFEKDPTGALRAKIGPFRPDLVALGMRNIQNNDYSGISDNLAYYGELISLIQETTYAPVVIGGSGFSVMPRELMERLRPDFGIAGEGELAFPRLVEALEHGPERLPDVASLHRFADGQLVSTPPASRFLDMNQLPLPDRSLADPRYYDGYGIDSIQTKRGCPLRGGDGRRDVPDPRAAALDPAPLHRRLGVQSAHGPCQGCLPRDDRPEVGGAVDLLRQSAGLRPGAGRAGQGSRLRRDGDRLRFRL
jgi:hypothetical protein